MGIHTENDKLPSIDEALGASSRADHVLTNDELQRLSELEELCGTLVNQVAEEQGLAFDEEVFEREFCATYSEYPLLRNRHDVARKDV